MSSFFSDPRLLPIAGLGLLAFAKSRDGSRARLLPRRGPPPAWEFKGLTIREPEDTQEVIHIISRSDAQTLLDLVNPMRADEGDRLIAFTEIPFPLDGVTIVIQLEWTMGKIKTSAGIQNGLGRIVRRVSRRNITPFLPEDIFRLHEVGDFSVSLRVSDDPTT